MCYKYLNGEISREEICKFYEETKSEFSKSICYESHMLEMNSLEFFAGGYFGTSHFIYIDGKRKNKVIRYAKTPGGMYVDLKHTKNEINLYPHIVLKEIPLTSEQWLAFIED